MKAALLQSVPLVEESGFVAPINLDGAPFLPNVDEEFLASTNALDEDAPIAASSSEAALRVVVVDEEFSAPQIALIEDSPPPFLNTADIILTTPWSEDFAGSLPLEESLPGRFSVGPDNTPTPAPIAEEITSLPFEEPATYTVTIVEAAPSIFVQNEDFGGAHPTEDPPPSFVFAPEALPPLAVAAEDFAGSMPVDEPAPALVFAMENAWSTTRASEDFAGSLPIEEDAPRIAFIELTTQSAIVIDEEFVAPHIIEEAPYVRIELTDGIRVSVVDEDIAAPHLSEDAQFVLNITADAITAVVASEDFVSAQPLEEEPPTNALQRESDARAIQPQEEDFARSQPLEEESPVLQPTELRARGQEPVSEEAPSPIAALEEENVVAWTIEPSWIPTATVDEELVRSSALEDEALWSRTWEARWIAPVVDTEEYARVVPPPPPPPTPSLLTAPPAQNFGAGGGIHPTLPIPEPYFLRPPHKEKEDKRKDIIEEVDFALLPLGRTARVRALADGVVDVFENDKGTLVTRLTADDGTTYFYAKLMRVRSGRVAKGDVIGVTEENDLMPHMLPSSSASSEPDEEEEAPVFGVLPIARPERETREPQPLPEPAPQLRASTAEIAQELSTTRKIVVGVGLVGIVIGIAFIIQGLRSPTRRSPPRKRKRPRRRR